MGLFLLLFGLVQQRQALALQTWRSVSGVVIASELRSFQEWKDNVERTLYTPGVVYRYAVNGHEYTGDRYSLGAGTQWGKPQPVQKMLERFPAGGAVTVFYNPKAPAEAVLERRVRCGWLIWLLAAGLLLLAVSSAGIL